eukprot:evm.model.scf_42.3 EVM.evm.TU.scf_42.3   scf_42:23201-24527(-)
MRTRTGLFLAALLAACVMHSARCQEGPATIEVLPECMGKAQEVEALLERHPYCMRALRAKKRCPLTSIEVDACAKTMKESVVEAMRVCQAAAENEGGLRFFAKLGGPCKFGEKLGTMEQFET